MMSLARKCDVCGAFEDVLKSNYTPTLTVDLEQYDLCNKCYKELAKFLGNKKPMDPFQMAPIDEKILLIDEYHRQYIGTITFDSSGVRVRGECYSGDPDSFYRNAIVNWAYLDEKQKGALDNGTSTEM